MKKTILFLSCEHGGNEVPEAYQHLFAGHEAVLNTHRGIDFGALAIMQHLQKVFRCESVYTTVTRLLIDCNRSLTHPHCFSEFTKKLSPIEKQRLIEQYYLPHRQRAEAVIQRLIDEGNQVLHLSIHSFTPEFNGTIRNAAIGLLYDSKHHGEKEVARLWHELLLQKTPAYRIRNNYPYRGSSDGFTQYLRKKHSEQEYLGFEVESNQALVQTASSLNELSDVYSHSLSDLLELLS